jgi:hypothetical protein
MRCSNVSADDVGGCGPDPGCCGCAIIILFINKKCLYLYFNIKTRHELFNGVRVILASS